MNSFQNYANFTYPVAFQDNFVDKMGTKFFVFRMKNNLFTGYEDIVNKLNSYKDGWVHFAVDGFIKYDVKKSKAWKFGWEPESTSEMATAIFRSNSGVMYDDFIVANNLDGRSIYGDIVFRVAKVEDGGMFKTLQRTWYLRIISAAEVNEIFKKIIKSGEFDR